MEWWEYLGSLGAWLFGVGLRGNRKALKPGLSFEGPPRPGEVEFIYDLTYNKGDMRINFHNIFPKIYETIDQAEKFVLVDMFLFNSYHEGEEAFPALAESLTTVLVEKKKNQPEVEILLITDEINTFYGAYPLPYLDRLKEAGVETCLTNLNYLRDPNPVHSALWRTFFQWFGTRGYGWLNNAFCSHAPKVNLRAYLKLMNLKANHRKVIITEKEAIISSANPHDASGFHSNIAFLVKGPIISDLVSSEEALTPLPIGIKSFLETSLKPLPLQDEKGYRLTLLTEGKIGIHLLNEIKETRLGHKIYMAIFYLADRELLKELIKAAHRGVEVYLILDLNKDAFGRQKNGIPNRPVAYELVRKSKGRIQVRWYNTKGEQFHCKLAFFQKGEEAIIIGGSANFTRRNLRDYNLETDLKIEGRFQDQVVQDVYNYFQRLWLNQDGDYTQDFGNYREESKTKYLLYRFQEWSGISGF